MSYFDLIQSYNWQETTESIFAKTESDVQSALARSNRTMEDFKALISPAALPFLEQMAVESRRLTQKRFGKTIQLYAPLYLSNECSNSCIYCGFNVKNKINRLTLNKEQTLKEVEAIKAIGHKHLLLVTGEHPKHSGFEYLKEMIELVKPHFAQVSIEVQPMTTAEYHELSQMGMNGVFVYQETYNEARYPHYHPKGKKADFQFRVETPDRLGEAGVHKIGLGCLIGLEDWRTDSFFTALHLTYLEKKYWKTKYSIAFPRLRPHQGEGFQPNSIMSDKELLQLICAYRLLDGEVELSISTRERPYFRDNLVQLGITAMSAGSKTEPGGYALNTQALEQFVISDDRSSEEIEKMIREKGYEAVWKDWDGFMQTSK